MSSGSFSSYRLAKISTPSLFGLRKQPNQSRSQGASQEIAILIAHLADILLKRRLVRFLMSHPLRRNNSAVEVSLKTLRLTGADRDPIGPFAPLVRWCLFEPSCGPNHGDRSIAHGLSR